jgi:DNA/RNA-binding domain of Phe-tRNA-synthetase-like protein
MKLRIDPAIYDQYPGTLIGVVMLQGIDNHGEASEIQSLLREAEQVAIQRVDSIPIIDHHNIACWREVYRKFGAKPKKYPSSIENLVRRVSAGE